MKIWPLARFLPDVQRARKGGAFGEAERDAAATIVAAVRREGDAALLRAVRRFDRASARAADLLVDRDALERAAAGCPPELRRALDVAHARIRAFHLQQRPRDAVLRTREADLQLMHEPLDAVGALVPRGARSYPSTALMTGVPARVAGVRRLVFASPMPPDGALDPALAYALCLVGADALYRAGGAAAVAALAYGTRSIARVDKVVGPGNAYAAAAKWLVSADVGIDALQGPSELVVVASSDAHAPTIALDLLAQAEHGAGAFAALIADDRAWTARALATIGANGRAPIRAYVAPDLDAAIDAANDAAPEHLLLAGRRAAALARRARSAGAVFVGEHSAVAFGDYVAGTNHSLPTGGTARWSSALGVADYVRWSSRVTLRGRLGRLASAGAAIATHEGMRYHAASLEARA
jgi:histidinol dehydrogenase